MSSTDGIISVNVVHAISPCGKYLSFSGMRNPTTVRLTGCYSCPQRSTSLSGHSAPDLSPHIYRSVQAVGVSVGVKVDLWTGCGINDRPRSVDGF